MICDYGCGREARYYSENYDSWRCSKNPASCPAIRKKIIDSRKRVFVVNGKKKCSSCGKRKAVDDFHPRKDRKTGSGLQSWCKECNREVGVERYKKRIALWRGYFHSRYREEVECEICGKILQFSTGKNAESVHFDHRHGEGKIIRGYPHAWLGSRIPSPKNIKIFEAEDFGLLCAKCNRSLSPDPKIRRRLKEYCDVGQTQLQITGMDEGES